MSGITLSQQEVDDLRAFLDSLGSAPTTPQDKYEVYCANCHGPQGSGGSGGRLGAESAAEIAEAIGEEPEMALPSLSLLTPVDLDDLAAYLGTLPRRGG